jgi:WD40 repeat protein
MQKPIITQRLFLLSAFFLLLSSVTLFSQIIGDTSDLIWKTQLRGIETIEFSPDSKYILVYNGWEKSTKIYITENGELLKSIPLQEHSTWSKDGNFIATNSHDSIFIWHFPSLDTFRIIKTNTHPFGTTLHISFSWDNRYISSAEQSFGFNIWDIQNGEKVKIVKQFPYSEGVYAWKSMFTKDNRQLLYSDGYYSYLYDLEMDKIIKSFKGGLGIYSPDETKIATQMSLWFQSEDSAFVFIYDANSFERLRTLKGDFPGYMTFCFSADSKYLITEPDVNVWPLGIPVWELFTGNVAKFYNLAEGNSYYATPSVSLNNKYISLLFVTYETQPPQGYLTLLKANWNGTGIGESNGEEHKILYPNPATGMIIIQFELPVSSNVRIILTDLRGIQIEFQDLGFFNEGMNVLQYDAGRLPAGTYFLKIESGKYNETFRLVKE